MSSYAGNKVSQEKQLHLQNISFMDITFVILFLLNFVVLYREANCMGLNYSEKLKRSDSLSLLNSLTLKKKKSKLPDVRRSYKLEFPYGC